MWKSFRLSGAFIIAAALSACTMSHGPGGVAYSTGEPASVGGTIGAGAGTVSGSVNEPQKEKEQRGNTPPGKDRDGHGPADGAIVDPTGAATRGKPDQPFPVLTRRIIRNPGTYPDFDAEDS